MNFDDKKLTCSITDHPVKISFKKRQQINYSFVILHTACFFL